MTPIRVAVIGGGPAAMFFCHAWNKQKQQQTQAMLTIRCFERHSTPGGVWRTNNNNNNKGDGDEEVTPSTSSTRSVYDELWTNGPCQALEFYDYTLDEHFEGMSIPVYLPRRDMSEYILQRVTRDAPTFFDDYFEFNTEVVRVVPAIEGPNSDSDMFRVTTRNVKTGDISTRLFDKCIWAAGENGRPFVPTPLRDLFTTLSSHCEEEMIEEKKSCEPIPRLNLLHSAETTKIKKLVQDQRILLIGGAFSAEDLALQCLKWGAAHIDVVNRGEDSEITWTATWPGNRVQVHSEMAIKSVEKDGSILLEKITFDWPYGYRSASSERVIDENQSYHANMAKDDNKEDESDIRLRNIDTVIFCTGYQVDLTMLDESLRPKSGRIPAWYMGMDDSMNLLKDDQDEFSWTTWEMDSKNNVAQKYTGNVPAGQGRMVRFNYNHPEMHRGILFKNPNMMYLCEHGSDVPLLSLDIHAWLLCSYLTGKIPMPSVEELKAANRHQVLDQMNLPYLRYFMDEGYYKVLNEVEALDVNDCGYWPKDKDTEKCGYWDSSSQYTNYMFRLLAKVMEEGQYPGISLGSYHKLNKKGKAMINFGLSSYYMRSDLGDYKDGHEWRTFRDDVVEPEYIYSLYTGSEARPLRQRWMNIVDTASSIKNGDL